MLTYPQFFLYRTEYTVAIILVISNPPIHQNPGLKSSQKIPGLPGRKLRYGAPDLSATFIKEISNRILDVGQLQYRAGLAVNFILINFQIKQEKSRV